MFVANAEIVYRFDLLQQFLRFLNCILVLRDVFRIGSYRHHQRFDLLLRFRVTVVRFVRLGEVKAHQRVVRIELDSLLQILNRLCSVTTENLWRLQIKPPRPRYAL